MFPLKIRLKLVNLELFFEKYTSFAQTHWLKNE